MGFENILHTEAGLTVLGTVLGGLWAFFKSTNWYARLRRRRYYRAVQALEAGVEHTYRTYVRAIKEASADGRLSEEERRRARAMARDAAVAFGRSEGVDVLRELGEAYIDLWLSRLVQRMKHA